MLKQLATVLLFAIAANAPARAETLSFGTLSFHAPGPQFSSLAHALSTDSAGTNSATISFNYTQDAGPLGNSAHDLIVEIYTPDNNLVLLDPIPGTSSAPPTGTIHVESRRFFFEPVTTDGPWAILVYQRFGTSSERVQLSNVVLATDIRPEPVTFENVPLNDGFLVDEFGYHPCGTLSFRVSRTGDYDILADWLDTAPGPGEIPTFLGDLYLFEGNFTGDFGTIITVGRALYDDPFQNSSIIDSVYLEAGRIYTLLGATIPPDTDPTGYATTITVTGDGRARLAPTHAPEGPTPPKPVTTVPRTMKGTASIRKP